MQYSALVSDSKSAPDPIALAIGSRVRAIRNERQLTLEALSAQAAVSRRTLTSVELGQANASISVLLRIAEALNVSLSTLIEPVDTSPFQVRRNTEHSKLWSGELGGQGVLVGAINTAQTVEMWDWTLHPGEFHSSEAHSRGTREIAYVLVGSLELTVGTTVETLDVGDSAVMFGDQSHQYRCAGNIPVRFCLAVYESQVGMSQ